MVNWLQDTFEARPHNFNGELSSVLTKEKYGDEVKRAGLELLELGETEELATIAINFGDTSMVWAVAHT